MTIMRERNNDLVRVNVPGSAIHLAWFAIRLYWIFIIGSISVVGVVLYPWQSLIGVSLFLGTFWLLALWARRRVERRRHGR